MTTKDLDAEIAKLAAQVVADEGGFVTFAQYDLLMSGEVYFTPLHWIDGWELPSRQRKANHDKLAAFKAVELGLLEQTTTGYRSL